jgi:glycine/D-amino acid oxidase-like deaminating enzyme
MMPDEMKLPGTPLIIGQGLAGICLAWEFLRRGVPFRIADRGVGGSTRVAAGLINPITGKNFEPSWRIADFHPQAIAFYRSLEEEFGLTLWHPLPVLRLASSEKEWAKISAKMDLPEVRPWVGATRAIPKSFLGGVELTGGGWLDTRKFVQLSADHFRELGLSAQTGKPRIRCEGAAGLIAGSMGGHRCAKGEILTVQADWPETHIRIGAGGWLVPIGGGCFRVGSTYDWDNLDEQATAAGLERITAIAAKLGGADFEVIAHVAGIRPILRRSQPLVGKDESGDWVFNGLGSKGTLYAPGMAAMLADWILDGVRPDPEFVFPDALF